MLGEQRLHGFDSVLAWVDDDGVRPWTVREYVAVGLEHPRRESGDQHPTIVSPDPVAASIRFNWQTCLGGGAAGVTAEVPSVSLRRLPECHCVVPAGLSVTRRSSHRAEQ
ncbi:hypothetical protein GCM10009581_22390 [Tsukamurella strandjordii]